jgi:exonuclease SbcD
MKEPLTIFSNDWHIKESNKEQIIDLVKQKCELASSLNIDKVFCLGDIFESRIAQRLDVLNTFNQILDIFESYKIKLISIPGNHDKTVYSSKESFLDSFRRHPYFDLIDEYKFIQINDSIVLHLIPFFEDNVFLNIFNNIKIFSDYKNILLSHLAVEGSRNNDGSIVKNERIAPSLFSSFYKVFLGHYHNTQKIGENIFHLPSIQQNNYGEDNNKGFTILYNDGSHEIVKSKFKEYIKIVIDVDETSNKELADLRKKYSKDDNNIRFELKGSENILKSIKKDDFVSLGIDVKIKTKEIEANLENYSDEVVEHNSSTIKEAFDIFCEKEKLNKDLGIKYLNKKLKK